MKKACEFTENIYMYFNDELDSVQVEELFKHMENCRMCKEEFKFMDSIQNGLKDLEEVELPSDYGEKLHQKLIDSNNTKIIKFENYAKFINRFISTAAAVVLLAVITKGVYLFNANFNKSNSLADMSARQMESLTMDSAKNNENNLEEQKVKAMKSQEYSMAQGANNNNLKNDKTLESRTKSGEVLGMGESQYSSETSKNASVSNDTALIAQSSPDSIQPGDKSFEAVGQVKEDTNDTKTDLVRTMTEKIADNADSSKEIPYETISKGALSGHNEKRNYVIKDNDQWNELKIKINPDISALQEVDFNQAMVIAAFQGTQNSGGYSIEIIKVIDTENNIEVHIKEVVPAKDSVTTTVITSPYHMVKVSKDTKEIVFIEEK